MGVSDGARHEDRPTAGGNRRIHLGRAPVIRLGALDLLASCWHGVVVGEDAITRVRGRLRRLADGIGEGQFKLETITKSATASYA